MKIVVMSGCQTDGLVSAIRLLLPRASVTGYEASRFFAETQDEIRHEVKTADAVFAAKFPGSFGDYAFGNLDRFARRHICVPQVEFAGLHPDIVYVTKEDGLYAQSPCLDYHSNICLAAFLAGISAGRTASLYNALVFSSLGYFDAFDSARDGMLAEFAGVHLDIRPQFETWCRYPVSFMYSLNHPKSFVLADVALEACRLAGFTDKAEFDAYEMMPDALMSSFIMPVFPELAKRRGMTGSSLFRTAGGESAGTMMDIETFVTRSFAHYAGADVATWAIPARTQATMRWLCDNVRR